MTKLSVMRFLPVAEAAQRLGISVRQVQHLAARGQIRMVARGIVDAASVDRHLAVHATTHRRAWAEPTAWGAVALLSGRAPDWLDVTQRSRLRSRLRSLSAAQLVERARDRAEVTRYVGHSRGRDRLSAELVTAARSSAAFGLADTTDVDGYLAGGDVDDAIRRHGLRRDDAGWITLRATSMGLDVIVELVEAGPVLGALDLAESLDVRERAAGMDVLGSALGRLRG